MRFTSRFNAVGGISDFWHEFRRPNPYRWPILGASLLCTGLLLFWVTQERVYLPPERPKVSLIATFPEGRTDAEIIASNIANQQVKDRREAERAARDAEVKGMYRELGRATGLDVDAMERDIAAKEAAAAAARRAREAEYARRGEIIAPAAR